MPTKVDTETGWSKEFPKAQGWYWVRSGSIGLPVAVKFFPAMMDRRQPMVRYPGKNGFMVAVAEDGKPEWLGPISPSDFEQLIQLRRAARSVLQMYGDAPMPREVKALREALAPTEEK